MPAQPDDLRDDWSSASPERSDEDAGFAAAYADPSEADVDLLPFLADEADREAALPEDVAGAPAYVDHDAWWSARRSALPPLPAFDEDPERTQELTRDGRPARAARPPALPPTRALAGAAVAVAGVVLGIGTLLWATDGPSGDPTVSSGLAGLEQPVEGLPAAVPDSAEQAPVDPGAAIDAAAAEAAAAPPASAPAPAPAAEAAPAAAGVLPVTVLNNSRISGLAAQAAARFERGGWPIAETGSAGGRFRETTVYYDRGQEAAARALARQFGIERVLPRLDALAGSGLTVVVTRDFAQ